MGSSRTFGPYRPLRIHLVRGQNGLAGEVLELRTQVDEAFSTLEAAGYLALQTNSTIAPTVNNDASQGYEPGSRWFKTSAARAEYVCLSASIGAADWQVTTTPAGGGVASVFGRSGTISAVAGDYAASLVTNDSTVTGATVKDALDALKTTVGTPVQTSRLVGTGTGLLGGGALTSDLTITPDFGSGAGKVTQGNDSRLSDARTPVSHATSHKNGGTDEVSTATAAANAIPKAGAGGTLDIGWFPLGSSSTTVTVGNDSRLSNSRTPTGSAGGSLGGSYPNPTVAAINETSGPTTLTITSITDGQYLKRVGTNLVGAAAGTFVGPGSAVSGNVLSFNGTTGALGQDSGVAAASIVLGPASVTSSRIATFNGTTGKLLADGGKLISDLAALSGATFTGGVSAPVFSGTASALAFSASTALDLNTANDFFIGALTANITFTFTNPAADKQGLILVIQDGTGSRTVTFTPPATYTLMKDSTLANLTPASGAGTITLYSYALFTLNGTNYLSIGKSFIVAGP